NRDGRCRLLDQERRHHVVRDDEIDLLLDQVVRNRRKSLVASVGPPVFDLQIYAVGPTELRHPANKRIGPISLFGFAAEAEQSNHANRLRLCGRQRKRTAEQDYEISSSHATPVHTGRTISVYW